MKRFGVVMAGGGGTRFWPLSRRKKPKQLLNLTGKELLINEAIDRLKPLSENGEVFVVTGSDQARLLKELTGERLKDSNLIREPAARNTAPCIGLACIEISERFGDSILMVAPADPAIKDVEGFRQVLSAAADAAAEKDGIVTIGIKPDFPCTGYGYIRCEEKSEEKQEEKSEEKPDSAKEADSRGGAAPSLRRVAEFTEKPDEERAKQYVASGNYYWNSGMFVFRASVMLKLFERLLPDIHEKLEQIRPTVRTQAKTAVLQKIYPLLPKVSIDYGIMERAAAEGQVYMLPGDFGWSDVGSFPEMAALHQADERGNTAFGDVLDIDTENCVIVSSDRLVAALGVKDLIIAETSDAVLVCPKSRAQEIGKIAEKLKELEREELV